MMPPSCGAGLLRDIASFRLPCPVCPQIARTLALLGGLTWAAFATVPFIGNAVPQG